MGSARAPAMLLPQRPALTLMELLMPRSSAWASWCIFFGRLTHLKCLLTCCFCYWDCLCETIHFRTSHKVGSCMLGAPYSQSPASLPFSLAVDILGFFFFYFFLSFPCSTFKRAVMKVPLSGCGGLTETDPPSAQFLEHLVPRSCRLAGGCPWSGLWEFMAWLRAHRLHWDYYVGTKYNLPSASVQAGQLTAVLSLPLRTLLDL